MKVVIENNAPKLSLNLPHCMPTKPQMKTWCRHVLQHLDQKQSREIYIGLVNLKTIHELNLTYRHKDKPTNVLSFPFELPPGLDFSDIVPPLAEETDQEAEGLLGREEIPLGDILICPEIILKEAQEQHKLFQDHLAHMIIHGTLHLLGYDHEENSEAEIMENLEIKILKELNLPNPY